MYTYKGLPFINLTRQMRSLHSKNGANNYIFTWHDIKPFLNILTKINTYFFHWYTKAIILHIVNNKMKKLRFLSFLWSKVIWLKSFYFYDQTNKWKPKTLSEEWQQSGYMFTGLIFLLYMSGLVLLEHMIYQ